MPASPALRGPVDHRHDIVDLTYAVSVMPFAFADTPEIEPHRDDADLVERAGDRVHDLIGHRTAVQGMRMTDDGERRANRRIRRGFLDQRLDTARGAVDLQMFTPGRLAHPPPPASTKP